MLSKQVTKIVQNLEKKKFREKYNLFKIEGTKLVGELLHTHLKIRHIIAFTEWIEQNRSNLSNADISEVTLHEMRAISNFQSPPEVIALAEIPVHHYTKEEVESTLSLALNGIQDPGNLGTILRVADWFGIRHILCDHDCANAYNPKCIQASMGAIFRVHPYYLELPKAIQELKLSNFPVFGTFLDGKNIYTTTLTTRGLIVMGNEGKGIAPDIEVLTDTKLTIPNFVTTDEGSESLNVGVATGIILSEFKRRIY